jgi:ketosteroid isomerase-like protein
MLRSLLPLLLVSAVASFAQTAPTVIEALDRAWIKAVVGRDIAALDKMLAPDLIYGHASGVVDTKQSYLDKLKSGRQVYRSLEQRKVSVRIHGDAAITHSWTHVTGVNPAGPFDDKIMMIHVWVKKGGNWQLAGHQTTRVDKLPE